MKYSVHFIITYIIYFLVLTGCTSVPLEKNNTPDSIGGNSRTLILNYENRAEQYSRSNIESHLKIYIEIEKPFILTIPPLNTMDKIYSTADIEGTTVFRVTISSSGKILSSEKVLSAGLSLDPIAEDILKQIKLEPSYLAGIPGESSADIKISFRADGAE